MGREARERMKEERGKGKAGRQKAGRHIAREGDGTGMGGKAGGREGKSPGRVIPRAVAAGPITGAGGRIVTVG
jgi:hypothetical protein